MGLGGQSTRGPGWTGRPGASLTAQPRPLLTSVQRRPVATQVGVLSARGSQEVRAAQGAGAHRVVLRFLWVSVPVPTSAAGKALPTPTKAWSAGKGAGDGGRCSRPAPGHTGLDGADCEDPAASGVGAAGVKAPQAPPMSLREASACCGICTFRPSLPQALWGGHRPTPRHSGQDSPREPPKQDPVSPVLGVMGFLGDCQLLQRSK